MNGIHLIDLPKTSNPTNKKGATISRHMSGMELRTKKKLPKDFFETILNLENELFRTKSLEAVQTLVDLYKVIPIIFRAELSIIPDFPQ
jgi:hypothetical protein